jgi:hypothetical protein
VIRLGNGAERSSEGWGGGLPEHGRWVVNVFPIVAFALVTGLGVPSSFGGASGAPADKPSTKISNDLLALHASYLESRRRGVEFHPASPRLRVVDDRVVINATAAADAGALEADLVRLGLQHAASYGRVVSGEFPIAAIPSLDAVPSLRFARPSVTMKRSRGVPERPPQP